MASTISALGLLTRGSFEHSNLVTQAQKDTVNLEFKVPWTTIHGRTAQRVLVGVGAVQRADPVSAAARYSAGPQSAFPECIMRNEPFEFSFELMITV